MEEQKVLPGSKTEDSQTETKKGFLVFFEKNFLGLSILVAGILVSFSILYTSGSLGQMGAQIKTPDQNQRINVSVDDDPVMGSKNAKVVVIEFSDYQCPFCRSFWQDTLPQLKKDYIDTGKIKFVYRDYPLSFHPSAAPSAQSAECARDQDKYWEMHDKIFSEQAKKGQGTVTYSAQDLKTWASQIGLDAGQFSRCLDSGKYKLEVEKDFSDGNVAGVSGTPSFFINGRLIVGAQPFSAFQAIIDEELK